MKHTRKYRIQFSVHTGIGGAQQLILLYIESPVKLKPFLRYIPNMAGRQCFNINFFEKVRTTVDKILDSFCTL